MNSGKRTLLTIVFLSVSLGFCFCTEPGLKRNPYSLPIIQTMDAYTRQLAKNPEFEMVDLETEIKSVKLDIRYATPNNFTKRIIYSTPKAYARKPVAEALSKVQDSLKHYNLGLKIYDAYRPYAATLMFYEVYPDTNFVANPRKGSRHNRGCAIDLTLIELTSGKEIPMPTAFDDFSKKAHPDNPDLPDTVLKNRAFLFGLMKHFGFNHISSEWWHFDYVGWKDYPLMDLSFDELAKKK
jgi:D-alanyl-D-alanine dipeptidase